MRRKDREVVDKAKIQDIIDRCYCCRIGFNDNGEVYIIPLNFGYEKTKESYTFYFHSAKEGKKIDLIHKSPNVGFELDTNYKLNEADIACEFSARFQSIIGNGVVSVVTDPEEKKKGLCSIMEHNTGGSNWDFNEIMLNSVCVFKMAVTKMACKEHL